MLAEGNLQRRIPLLDLSRTTFLLKIDHLFHYLLKVRNRLPGELLHQTTLAPYQPHHLLAICKQKNKFRGTIDKFASPVLSHSD